MASDVPDIVTFGEIMGVVRIEGPISQPSSTRLSFAGAEGNVAIGLSRLGHRIAWCGSLGEDGIGDHIFRSLRAEGVSLEWATRDQELPTGLLISYDIGGGLRRVDYHRRESAGGDLDYHKIIDVLRRRPKILHITGITPALNSRARKIIFDAVTVARDSGVLVSFDLNYRKKLLGTSDAMRLFGELVDNSDFVFGSQEELSLLCPNLRIEDLVVELLRKGCGEVVVKKGAEGAEAFSHHEHSRLPARDVPVIDTVGAGDAFVAGYLSGFLSGLPLAKRLERANILGSIAVSSKGDWEGLPTRSLLTDFDVKPGEVVR